MICISVILWYRFIFLSACVDNSTVVFFSPGFNFDFSVLAKLLARKSISDMSYLASSGMLNLNSINAQCSFMKIFHCDISRYLHKLLYNKSPNIFSIS